jgi:hypothetical protein
MFCNGRILGALLGTGNVPSGGYRRYPLDYRDFDYRRHNYPDSYVNHGYPRGYSPTHRFQTDLRDHRDGHFLTDDRGYITDHREVIPLDEFPRAFS